MTLQPTFDYGEAKRRKDAGMNRVAANSPEWQAAALDALRHLATVYHEITSDDLHMELEIRGVGNPHHDNAWGTPFRTAGRLGILKKLATTTPSERPTANGREVRVWESLIHPERK